MTYTVIANDTDTMKLTSFDGSVDMLQIGEEFYADNDYWIKQLYESLEQGRLDEDYVKDVQKAFIEEGMDMNNLYTLALMLGEAKGRGWF